MVNLHKTVSEFDFDTATSYDVAVLLEQVFLHHDGRGRDGGPIIITQGILDKFSEALQRRLVPVLHTKVKGRCAELRSTLLQLDDVLRHLEKDNAQTST